MIPDFKQTTERLIYVSDAIILGAGMTYRMEGFIPITPASPIMLNGV